MWRPWYLRTCSKPIFSAARSPAHLDKIPAAADNEMATDRPSFTVETMTYLELLRLLEERLGRLHVPLRANASTVHELFDGCALHHELMTALVRAVYTGNRCHHVKDRVTPDKTLQAIGPIRTAILNADDTDIDTYRFVEAFFAEVQKGFGQHQPKPHRRLPQAGGQIIAFPRRLAARL